MSEEYCKNKLESCKHRVQLKVFAHCSCVVRNAVFAFCPFFFISSILANSLDWTWVFLFLFLGIICILSLCLFFFPWDAIKSYKKEDTCHRVHSFLSGSSCQFFISSIRDPIYFPSALFHTAREKEEDGAWNIAEEWQRQGTALCLYQEQKQWAHVNMSSTYNPYKWVISEKNPSSIQFLYFYLLT